MNKRHLWLTAIALTAFACGCSDDSNIDTGTTCDFKKGSCECASDDTHACADILSIQNATYTCSNENKCVFSDCQEGFMRDGNKCVALTNVDCETKDDCTVENAINYCTKGKCGFVCDTGYETSGDGASCDKVSQPSGDGTLKIVTPTSKHLELSPNESSDVTVMYIGSDGPGVDVSVNIESSNKDCVASMSGARVKTDKNGKADFNVKARGSDCQADLKFTAGNSTEVVSVDVTDAPDYKVSFNLNYLDAYDDSIGSQIHEISRIAYGPTVSGSCPDDELLKQADLSDFLEVNTITNGDLDSLTENPVYNIPNVVFQKADGNQTIAAVAYAQDGSTVIAYGCSDVFDKNANGSTVDVNIAQIPYEFLKSYEVVSNFDLTSGFPDRYADIKNLPRVEKMKGGDWIQFMVDLFDKPVDTLVYFVWSNSLERLNDIDGMPDWVSKYIIGDTVKALALPVLSNYVKGYLDELKGKDGKMSWYQTLTTIAPDVSDLMTNMQFRGEFAVGKINGKKISDTVTTYRQLEYQWSYPGSESECVKDAYGKTTNKQGKPTCHLRMMLDKVQSDAASADEATMAGTWNGLMGKSPKSDANATLQINSHSLSFKWASILYTAVFGTILPKALGYTLISDDKGEHLLKSFMTYMLFNPIVDYYNTNCAGNATCKGGDVGSTGQDGEAKTYSKLKIDGTNQDCERFIEVLVNLIYKGASDNKLISGGISLASDLACGEKGIGQLEQLVIDQLSQFNATTDNALMLSSSDCMLHAGEDDRQTTIVEIGLPDDDFRSANDIFTRHSSTKRCTWDVNTAIGSGYNIKGVFHGYEKSKK